MRKIQHYLILYRVSLLTLVAIALGNIQMQAQCPVTPDFAITEQFCDSIVLTNLSTPVALIDSVVWEFGDGETLTEVVAPFDTIHVYANPGYYNITMTTWDNTHCSDSKTIQLIIEKPVAAFKADTVCIGQTTSMIDLSTTELFPINTWLWEYDGGTTSTFTNPTHIFSTPGEHDVKMKVTNTIGCSDSTNHNIRVGDFP
ncbi:MAG: PKD domain-containing protein [Bacteroidales bacterium]